VEVDSDAPVARSAWREDRCLEDKSVVLLALKMSGKRYGRSKRLWWYADVRIVRDERCPPDVRFGVSARTTTAALSVRRLYFGLQGG
jgi:hypothetical protein